jgi:two-component system NtrC family sensor kinase
MSSGKILVVDDSREMRELITHYLLEPHGYETLVAEDGAAGLGLARLVGPDLIIADVQMPEMTGLELAQALHAEGRDLPVILISTEGPEKILRAALRAGVADYVTKPFTPEDLLDAVRHALEGARARRERARQQIERAALTETLTQQLKELETLIGVGRNVTSVLDLDQVLAKVVEAAVALTRADEGSLLLLDERTGELTMRAAKNFDDDFVRTFRLRSQDSLAGEVIRTGQPALVDDQTPQKIKTAYLVHALLYVPLKVHGRVIGVLGVDNRRAGRAFTAHDQQVLQALGDYAAIAIENARLYLRTEAERAQLETILQETEDGVVVVDPDNRLILANPTACAALGINGAGFSGQKVDDVIPHADVRDLFAGDNRRGEVTLEDGRTFNAHLTPIAGVGRAMILQDITTLKELDRIKSEFVTTVSHDLRSPLTAILGYVDLIARVGPVNDQQTEFIRRIQFGVQSIVDLISDLLDLGRIEAGFDSQKEVTHVEAVARYVVETLRPQAEAKRQRLAADLPDALPPVLANPLRLRQAAANLIENAIKYTPEGGGVGVKVYADDDQIILAVSDTGIGIPLADQPYVFDKFHRAANVQDKYAGSGLGLSIVKSIVDNHNGRVWLESKPKAGTTFTVVLPQHREAGGGRREATPRSTQVTD